MEFRILGPLEARDGERALELGGPRRRSLLARLLLDANRAVPYDALVDALWGEHPPAAARASLRNHAARLRQELGDRLVTHGDGYLLQVRSGELDLERFTRLVGEARGADPARRASLLGDALALWRGPALADLAGEPVCGAVAHLDELRLSALEDRIEAELDLGGGGELVAEVEALVAEHPFRERLRGQLMRALYRAGRQADALETYAATRRLLVEELGAEPSPRLQELQRAILRQDPALGVAAAAPATSPDLAAAPESRKVVTVVAADLASERELADPEARRHRLAQRAEEAADIVARHGGASTWLGGERLLVVFGVPRAHEDDALRAVRAAHELRHHGAVRRAGIATGEVVTGDPAGGRPLASGFAIDEADRLRGESGDGHVRVLPRTWRLVRHAADGEQSGGAWLLECIDPAAPPLLRRLETPLVGRADELEEVLVAFRRAEKERRPQLVTVFGAPGIGKTRLAAECAAALGTAATAAFGRCAEGGQGATYAPLRDALSDLVEGDPRAWLEQTLAGEHDGEAIAADLFDLVYGGSTVPVEEAAWAIRRLLETLARPQPLLLVLDDVQWAAAAVLDLLESVVELVPAPVLVLCLSRPELLDARPFWGGGRLSSSSILLDALSDRESSALLAQLTEAEGIDGHVRNRILEVAEGNPLFLEQLLASALEGQTERVPDSIQALLATRLDHLPPRDLEVAQAAAVIGLSISTRLVERLVEARASESLRTLARRELVRRTDTDRAGNETWEFRHALIRDEAYRSLPKARRAVLHESVAQYVAETANGDADVIAGYHLEQAFRARTDVGEPRAKLHALARAAARHLGAAGLAAYERSDLAACVALLGSAVELSPDVDLERVRLARTLTLALFESGDVLAARGVLADARGVAAQLDDEVGPALVTLTSHQLDLWGDEPDPPERVLADLDRVVSVLRRAGDFASVASAELLRFHTLDRTRSALDPERQLELAVAAARRSGSPSTLAQALKWTCICLPRSTVPVDDAVARVTAMLDDAPNRLAEASALGALGLLRAMQGSFDEARELVSRNISILTDLGDHYAAAAHAIAIGEVELMAGAFDAAERVLRRCYEEVSELGNVHSAGNAAWRLALALCGLGREDEAEPFARVAAESARGVWVEIWWRVVQARVEAHRGHAAAARRFSDAARSFMSEGELRGMRADALLELAEAARIVGDLDQAAQLTATAEEIARHLGYTVALERARSAQRALTA